MFRCWIAVFSFQRRFSSSFFEVLLISSRIFRMNQCMFVHERTNNVPIHLECRNDCCSIIFESRKRTKKKETWKYFDRIGMGLHLRKSTKQKSSKFHREVMKRSTEKSRKMSNTFGKERKKEHERSRYTDKRQTCVRYFFFRLLDLNVAPNVTWWLLFFPFSSLSLSLSLSRVWFKGKNFVVISVDKYLFNSSVVHLAVGAFGVVVCVIEFIFFAFPNG